MNKKILASLLFLGLSVGTSHAASGLFGGADSLNYTIIVGTSGTVFSGAGSVYGVVLSTGNGITHSVLLDTVTTMGNVSDPTLNVWNPFRASVPMVHVSTTSAGPGPATAVPIGNDVMGVRFKRGCVVGGNGAANSIGVYWKK